MFEFHFIRDMIRDAQHCIDCGTRLNLTKEIRRCKKCKEEYKKDKEKSKQK